MTAPPPHPAFAASAAFCLFVLLTGAVALGRDDDGGGGGGGADALEAARPSIQVPQQSVRLMRLERRLCKHRAQGRLPSLCGYLLTHKDAKEASPDEQQQHRQGRQHHRHRHQRRRRDYRHPRQDAEAPTANKQDTPNARDGAPFLHGVSAGPALLNNPSVREAPSIVDSTHPEHRLGACTFTSIVTQRTCPGPMQGGWLTIVFDQPLSILHGADSAALRNVSYGTRQLVLQGPVEQLELEWVLNHGPWQNVTLLEIHGMRASHFNASLLHRFHSLTDLDLSDNRLPDIDFSLLARAPYIKSLDLFGNALTQLRPGMFAGMSRLHTLVLSYNHLRRVPRAALAPLRSLEDALFDRNHIAEVEPHAFDALPRLVTLDLGFNSIRHYDPDTFINNTQLYLLWLEDNPIEAMSADIFRNTRQISHLSIANTRIRSLPPHIFRAMPDLQLLYLHDTLLTQLPPTLFAGLTRLHTLTLTGNRLSSLPSTAFADQNALRDLALDENKLTRLSVDLLAAATNLKALFLNTNALTSIPPGFLSNTANLDILLLGNNRLTSADFLKGASLPSLSTILLPDNAITGFDSTDMILPHLRELDLNNNPITQLPAVGNLPELETLRLQYHRIQHIDLTRLLLETPLHVLEMDAGAPILHKATATADPDALAGWRARRLRWLLLAGIDASPLLRALLQHQRQALQQQQQQQQRASQEPGHDSQAGRQVIGFETLHLGWPGMDEDVLSMDELCLLFSRRVTELQLTDTAYSSINLCANTAFESVFLQHNPHLQSVAVPSSLHNLNVSGCSRLSELAVPFIHIFDMSYTRIVPSGALCATWGRDMLFARDLKTTRFGAPAAVEVFLDLCLDNAVVLDLSDNEWLDTPSLLNPITRQLTILSAESFVRPDQVTLVHSRESPPLFQLEGARVQCHLRLVNANVRSDINPLVSTNELAYFFDCECARSHSLSGGRCVSTNPNIAAVAAGSVLGGLALGLLMAWLSRRYHRLSTRLDLHRQLLLERDEEVLALKKAWEIGFDELRLIKRVAAGAFGVVYKAQWDTVTVAVKVLQESMMLLDESTVHEFEKEVEFLQRTRHPHVVRFFGAGTDPSGSPFLVLEFVALGSLKDLLARDMDVVLAEFKNRLALQRREEAGSNPPHTNSAPSTVTVAPTGGSEHDHLPLSSVWGLKLRLLRHVASGMAFIHSLGSVHRDLKSANVLVSTQLSAKITDFGSIRQCLTPRSKHTTTSTAISSVLGTAAGGDVGYSPGVGGETMHLTMTAGVGTPLYMAPEAVEGSRYDAKADVYSFGVLMWEVAMEQSPDLIEQEMGGKFRGPLLATMLDLLSQGKRLKFQEGVVPEWFEDLSYECMAHDPAQRPSFSHLETTALPR